MCRIQCYLCLYNGKSKAKLTHPQIYGRIAICLFVCLSLQYIASYQKEPNRALVISFACSWLLLFLMSVSPGKSRAARPAGTMAACPPWGEIGWDRMGGRYLSAMRKEGREEARGILAALGQLSNPVYA